MAVIHARDETAPQRFSSAGDNKNGGNGANTGSNREDDRIDAAFADALLNPRERMLLLKVEQDIVDFVKSR